MGNGSFDAGAYDAATRHLAATGATFARSAAAARDPHVGIADILDPRKLKNGIRECCFAPGFDDATAIVVALDGTGSMQDVPGELQKELPKLITLLKEQGVTDRPNVMFEMFDDVYATPPDAKFQMGQFETAAPELLTALNEMIIPGNGGGNRGEAYHLAIYAAAHHTKLECFDRDGKKGFFFMVCDEEPYYDDKDPAKHGTTPEVAREVFGDKLEAEETMLDSLKELCKRYHVFIIRPEHTAHGRNPKIAKQWQDMLRKAGENPQHVLQVAETDAIVATMALCVGTALGAERDDLVDVLRTKGAAGVDAANAATTALVLVGDAKVAKAGTATAALATGGGGARKRR
jgi:hypothetical protein